MPKLILYVGNPGSGKNTFANSDNTVLIDQDQQGKEGHLRLFQDSLKQNLDISVTRMNFSKEQRARYLEPAKKLGYVTEIRVIQVPKQDAIKRCNTRFNHPTIKTELDAKRANGFFFKSYERPTSDEADVVTFMTNYETKKRQAIVIDIDGTLANIEHRQHFVQGTGKKNWKGFFANMDKDVPNDWCVEIINKYKQDHLIVLCSGRPDSFRETTTKWLKDNNIFFDELYMRPRDDMRADSIVKEIILDFELAPRYNIKMVVDDRMQVCDMWRSRGLVVLQCAKGEY